MKNKTFLSIISWTILWSLITVLYLVFGYGFEVILISYAVTGILFTSFIIREEFLKRVKNAIKL